MKVISTLALVALLTTTVFFSGCRFWRGGSAGT